MTPVFLDFEHLVPHQWTCFVEGGEDDKASIVYERVQPIKPTKRKFHDAVCCRQVAQVLVATNCGPALCCNGRDDTIGNGRVEAATVLCDTGIMHRDAGAAGG